MTVWKDHEFADPPRHPSTWESEAKAAREGRARMVKAIEDDHHSKYDDAYNRGRYSGMVDMLKVFDLTHK